VFDELLNATRSRFNDVTDTAHDYYGQLGSSALQGVNKFNEILNHPLNSWSGMGMLPKAGLGLAALLGTMQHLYHGTSKANAEKIMREGFDLAHVGKGADAGEPGWYGQGIYLSKDADKAKWYSGFEHARDSPAVLKTLVDDQHIFDASPHGPNANPKMWEELLNAYDAAGGNKKMEYRDFLNSWAQKRGFKGVAHANGDIVVFDPSIVKPESTQHFPPMREGTIEYPE
jgi:hypothetical protein